MSMLILMVGVSGSGKSTFASYLKNLMDSVGQSTMIISSDEIRESVFGDVSDQTHNEEVFKEVRRRINNCIDKMNIIVDATNINIKSRKSLLDLVRNKKNVAKFAYVIATPIHVCKRQNNVRTRKVPEEVIDKQVRKFEIPFCEEGFDEVKIVEWDYGKFKLLVPEPSWATDDNYVEMLMKDFDQKNHHHKYTLDEHCRRCAEEVAKRTNDKILYRAAQLHDVGKLWTGKLKEDGSGDYCYYDHHNIGAYFLLTDTRCCGFTDVEDLIKCIFYVNYHMIPFSLKTEKSIMKWKTIFGEENFDKLSLLHLCDKIASGREKID